MRFRLAVFALLGLLLVACGSQGENSVNLEQAPDRGETRAERDAKVASVFAEPPTDAPANETTTREIQAVFTKLTNAGRAYDADVCLKLVHFEHMMDLIVRGVGETLTPEQRRESVATMKSSARRGWFERGRGLFDWQDSRVVHVETSEDGKIAVAYVRHRMDEIGNLDKARWWLAKTDGGWKIYDWEFLSTGIRTSRLMIAMASSFVGSVAPPWVNRMSDISIARLAINEGRYQDGLDILDKLAGVGFPRDVEALRLQFTALCYNELGRYDEALKASDEALELKPDQPEAHFSRGRALYNKGEYEQARKELQWYIDTLGSDSITMTMLADCLDALGRPEEAKDVYRDSLRDIALPDSVVGLALVLDDDEMDEVGEWFLKLDKLEESYRYVAYQLYDTWYKLAAVKAVNEAYATKQPEDSELAWYRAKVLLDENQPGKAAELLKPAIERAPADETEAFKDQYIYAMSLAGKAVEVLKEFDGKREVFTTIAGNLFSDGNTDALEALCEAWREGNEKEPALHYNLGEADFLREDHAAAEKHYRDGLEFSEPRGDYHDALRRSLMFCMHKQGRTLEAYEELGGTSEVLSYLGDLLVNDGEYETLKTLVDKHAEKHRSDAQVNRFRGELAWHEEDWKTAASQLGAYIVKQKKVDIEAIAWTTLERCVRSYIRSDNLKLADSMAQNGLGSRDYYLLAVVYASFGHTGAAVDMIDEYLAEYGNADWAKEYIVELYWDEDCGEKLRGDEYKELHQRIPIPPEPKEEPAEEEEPEDKDDQPDDGSEAG